MEENKCPCNNCITLAMCKALMTKSIGIYVTLSQKCSIFKERYEYRYLEPDNPERLFVMELFKERRRINGKTGVRIHRT